MKNCSLWEGLMLEKFMENCSLVGVTPVLQKGKDSPPLAAAETTCDELTITPIPHLPVLQGWWPIRSTGKCRAAAETSCPAGHGRVGTVSSTSELSRTWQLGSNCVGTFRTFCRRDSGLYWKLHEIPVKQQGLLRVVLGAGVCCTVDTLHKLKSKEFIMKTYVLPRIILCTVVKESTNLSGFVCNCFAEVSKRMEKRAEPGGILNTSPSQSFLQESPQVPSTKDEPFDCACRFDTSVYLTNISGAEITIRLVGQTKMVSGKNVWRESVILELYIGDANGAVKLQ
ncbi:hypothetical protein BTVI_158402 [Pitangus sulphuratus]|nr:hypothetical protein BTVI_158402 [Pitangus sulphuratus]